MSDNVILFRQLVELLRKKAKGKSISYNYGWIMVEDIYSIADDIKNGRIDKFGNRTDK